jgi:hypothetical protein
MYDPLHFVLMYPHGEPGWDPDLRHADVGQHQVAPAVDGDAMLNGDSEGGERNKVTTREWAAYFMQV